MNDIDGNSAVILFVAISSIVLSIREMWKIHKRENEYFFVKSKYMRDFILG